MFGDNPKRGLLKSNGDVLQVQEIFPTLQGEGPHVGKPAVFLRLGGCNLACSFCDTEFEDFKDFKLDNIISDIEQFSLNSDGQRVRNLVVITGGEPFRQPIEKLCDLLIEKNFTVQIETNGTLFREINQKVEIICSPKNEGSGYADIRPDLLKRINAFKFIISGDNVDYSSIPEVGQTIYKTPVYIQPMDEYDSNKNHKNLQLCKKLADQQGYFLSLQTHKILDLP